MSVILYVLISIAVLNVLAIAVIARLGRRLGTAERRSALIVRRLRHPRANRGSSEQVSRARTHR
jgi:hypothetical protein